VAVIDVSLKVSVRQVGSLAVLSYGAQPNAAKRALLDTLHAFVAPAM